MKLKQLVTAVKNETGRDLSAANVRYARTQGFLSPAEKVGGWYDYQSKHVTELVEYCKERVGRVTHE